MVCMAFYMWQRFLIRWLNLRPRPHVALKAGQRRQLLFIALLAEERPAHAVVLLVPILDSLVVQGCALTLCILLLQLIVDHDCRQSLLQREKQRSLS